MSRSCVVCSHPTTWILPERWSTKVLRAVTGPACWATSPPLRPPPQMPLTLCVQCPRCLGMLRHGHGACCCTGASLATPERAPCPLASPPPARLPAPASSPVPPCEILTANVKSVLFPCTKPSAVCTRVVEPRLSARSNSGGTNGGLCGALSVASFLILSFDGPICLPRGFQMPESQWLYRDPRPGGGSALVRRWRRVSCLMYSSVSR